MKRLLIIGAGGHGKVVAEIAEDIGYEEIAFLDDNNLNAIGKVSDIEKFKGQYNTAFVGVGNNKLRGELIHKLKECRYHIPVLVHPTAYVSRTAKIGFGTVIEPRAIVNANACIAEGCIISVGSIIDHDAEVGSYSHINAGSIVKAGRKVEKFRKLEAGEFLSEYGETDK